MISVACSAVPDTTAMKLPGYSTPIARQHNAVSQVLLTEAAGFDYMLCAAIPEASAHHLLYIL